MIQVEEARTVVDGRAARRQRNVDTVLTAVVEMFTEGELFPSIDAVSQRSGVSVRSIYRYFSDPAELTDAAIRRHRELSLSLAHLRSIGQGPLAERIDDFVAMRIRLYEGVGAAYRATAHGAPTHPRLRAELIRNRDDLRHQFEQQFAPELAVLDRTEREAVVAAADVLTQLDAIEMLRMYRGLSATKTAAALCEGLTRILGADTTSA